MNRRAFLGKVKTGSIALASLPVLDTLATPASAQGGASHVRWDIISVNFPPSGTPTTLSPGGVALAFADATHEIKLTGSGTFVAPASAGISGAVTGGGTWETFAGGVSTGSGTYEATLLVIWQFFRMGQQTGFIDDIGDLEDAANGSALLRIEYSDGSQGTLGVGCLGPGAPAPIQEGVIATKGAFTYWTREVPVAGVDRDRTLFHVQ
jgi:hypothetical protein